MRGLWDRDSMPRDAYRLLSASPHPARLPYYPDCRPCHYLPLMYGSEYASGLTVYFDYVPNAPHRMSIMGIACHGPKTRLLGERSHIPIHMPLYNGEYINSLWVCVSGWLAHGGSDYAICVRWPCSCPVISDERAAPGLTSGCATKVTTSHDRSYFFGQAEKIQPSRRGPCRWRRVNTRKRSRITGIIVDAMTYTPEKKICDIGVAEDLTGRAGKISIVSEPRIPNYMRADPLADKRYMLAASLDWDPLIQVRRRGRRCLGLRLVRNGGTVRVIGRWDPDTANISTIYDPASDGPLTGVAFRMEHTDRRHMCVREIIPITSKSPNLPSDEGSLFTKYFACQRDGRVSCARNHHI